jgi:ATP-binding cassette, subfamily D (ALD), member 3
LDIWFTAFNGSVVRAIVTRDWKMFTRNAIYIFGFMMWPMSIVNNSIKLLISTLSLCFRSRLTNYAHDQYLKEITFYKVSNLDNRIRNVDQLITQDIVKFSDSLSHLYSDIAKPLVDIGLFALKLGQSIGSEAPLAMLSYFLASGMILRSISPPFGRFAAKEQSLEGEFRHTHSRLIGHSEEIAFYGGAEREKQIANSSFQKILDHANRVFFLRFGNGIIDSVLVKYCATQLAYYLLSRPVFKEQTATALTSLNDPKADPTLIMEAYSRNSGYLINLSQAVGRLVLAGRDLTRFAGYTWRVAELFDVLEDLSVHHRYQRTMISSGDGISEVKTISEDDLQGKVIETPPEDPFIEFDRVPIATPNGDILLPEISFRVDRGMNCMITGPNGCGKSSLFRILGSLWPLFGGKLTKPPLEEIFYVPQKPYLPMGTLRDQIIYPESRSQDCSDEDLLELLKIVHLEYLVEREGGWDAVRDWQDVLSGGEKQRIAMARLFHHRPAFAILDECTSAVSIDVEGLMYRYAQEALKITLFTVSHRPSLVPFHDYLLKFDGQDGYQFSKINHETAFPEEKKQTARAGGKKSKKHMKHVSIDTGLIKKSYPESTSDTNQIFSLKSPESSTISSDSSSPYLSSYNSVSTPHLLYSYPRSPYTEDKKDGGGNGSGNNGQK